MLNSMINFFLHLFRINRQRHFFYLHGPLPEAIIRTAIRLATLDGSELDDIKINVVIWTKKKGESK